MVRWLALLLIAYPIYASSVSHGQATPRRPSTLYVSPRGSDASRCTYTAPCRTLTHADELARPGTIVYVAAGVYGPVTLSAGGTATARIRWISERRWGAKIFGTSSGALTLVSIRGSYVDFEGFDVTGSGGSGTTGIDVAGSYSRAISDHIDHLSIPCDADGGAGMGGAGIDLSGSATGHDQEAIGNLVTALGSGPRDGSCRLVAGIYASVPRVKILVNVVAGAVGDGITSWHSATQLTIANNTSAHNGGYGVLIGGNVPPFNQGSYVVNNIAAFDYLGGIAECCDASPPQGGHYLSNLTYANGFDKDGPLFDRTPAASSGTLHVSPRFVNPAVYDYQLRAGSPALNTGTRVRAPTVDFNGHVRPKGAPFSRGAFSAWPRKAVRR